MHVSMWVMMGSHNCFGRCKGKLKLLEVFTRGHNLWGLQVPAEEMGKAVAGMDAVLMIAGGVVILYAKQWVREKNCCMRLQKGMVELLAWRITSQRPQSQPVICDHGLVRMSSGKGGS